MKVAVLLRGQARFSEIAAAMFKKTVVEQYPHIEFRFFGHTWRTMSVLMIDSESKNSVHRYHSKIFSVNEIIEKISPWTLNRFHISGDKLLYELSQDIIEKNIQYYNDQTMHTWLKNNWVDSDEYNGAKLPRHAFILYPGIMSMDYPAIANTFYEISEEQNRLYRTITEHKFYLGNLLGQMYSAGKSYECFCEREDQSWVPDVIWSTRWDGLFECTELYKVFYYVKGTSINQKPVYVRQVKVLESRAWIDDYNFFMTPDTAESFLGNMKERLFKIYTGSKINTLDLLNSNSHLQHLMWTKLARNGVQFTQMPVIGNTFRLLGWEHLLVRPGIEAVPPEEITMQKLKDIADNFDYPQGTGLIDIADMNKIMSVSDDSIE